MFWHVDIKYAIAFHTLPIVNECPIYVIASGHNAPSRWYEIELRVGLGILIIACISSEVTVESGQVVGQR